MDKIRFYPASLTTVAVTTAAVVFSFLFLISLTLPQLEPFMAILLTGIVFLGIPHGALDIFMLRKVAKTSGELLSLIGMYLFGVAVIAASWFFIPEGAFLFFIAFSCFHFALSDLSRPFPPTGWLNTSSLEFAARFLIPFFVPFGIHPERSIELARLVRGTSVFEPLVPVLFVLACVALALSVLVAFVEIVGAWKQKAEWRAVSLEPLVIFFLFFYLDPLYAFGIYFCFVHSVKHILNFLTSPIKVRFLEVLPYWLIPVAGLLILVLANASSPATHGPIFFKWAIILISAIAFPHTLLVYLGKKTRILR